MDLIQVQEWLDSQNPQDRMRAITALRNFDQTVAVPLLLQRLQDPEVIIRSFVAMGLGHKRNSEAFDHLLQLLLQDGDPNVRAEAANSLAKYGAIALPHLVTAFHKNRYWIVRLSILPIIVEMNCPEQLFAVCLDGLSDSDITVRAAAVEALGELVGSPYEPGALQAILPLVQSQNWLIRRQLALTLQKFHDPAAAIARDQLRHDPDHRVVAATLEALIA